MPAVAHLADRDSGRAQFIVGRIAEARTHDLLGKSQAEAIHDAGRRGDFARQTRRRNGGRNTVADGEIEEVLRAEVAAGRFDANEVNGVGCHHEIERAVGTRPQRAGVSPLTTHGDDPLYHANCIRNKPQILKKVAKFGQIIR